MLSFAERNPAQYDASGRPRPSPAHVSLPGKVIWGSCPTRVPKIEEKCGKYEVFEDRHTRAGRTISLNIIVIPATGAPRQPDPVFFFAGGPGQGATAGAGPIGRMGANRDLVFIDQRGTGRSNPLNCEEFDDPKDVRGFFGDLYPPEKMRACRDRLEKAANLSLYSTSIAVDDIDEVREALGYDQINLYGISYGTQAAQVYLRQHPEHVRAVLLEGVAPVDTKLPLQFARGAQAAMDSLFEDCAADPACHAAFPDLKKEFDAVLARFRKGPIPFEMTNPTTDQKEQLTISHGNFVVRLLSLLYQPRWASRVPFLLHRAFLDDFEPFASAAVRVNPGSGVARGVYFTITCSESIPFISERDIVRETKQTFVGDYRTRAHIAACQEWPRAEVPRNFVEPLKSDKPVLMISGMIDPATPFWLAQRAVRYLPHGRQLLLKNVGHGFGYSCVQKIAEEFLDKASVSEILTNCVDEIQRPPFVTDMSD